MGRPTKGLIIYDPTIHYDEMVVDALVQRYPVEGASTADNAAAVQRLTQRGWEASQIASLLKITERSVDRMKTLDIEPLPPIPDWVEKQWPTCKHGHELSPDNLVKRYYGREGKSYQGCRMCAYRYSRKYRNKKETRKVG